MADRKTETAEVTRDKGVIYLECRLTPEEIRMASKALAEAIQRKEATEARIEAFRTQAKAEIAELDASIQKNSSLVNNEKEFRNVTCEIQFDWRAGTKTFVRVDTGEVVRTCSISEDERQMHFTK